MGDVSGIIMGGLLGATDVLQVGGLAMDSPNMLEEKENILQLFFVLSLVQVAQPTVAVLPFRSKPTGKTNAAHSFGSTVFQVVQVRVVGIVALTSICTPLPWFKMLPVTDVRE